MIFNIQRFSTHDGKGIRTIIFYKGCPLHCLWCSNPEGISFGYSILYDIRNCKGFGECIKVESRAITRNNNHGILIDRHLINNPENLKDICPAKAITVAGEHKSVNDLLKEIEKDVPFYGKDGGVTLSGGEPLAQGKEVTSLLRELKSRNINVNIETSLHVTWDNILDNIGLINTYLTDLKHTDLDKFRTYTGGDAALVMDNLIKLAATGAHIIIRIPVIPGFNHTEKEMQEMIEFVSSLPVREIHFLPYHTLGMEKYNMLGLQYRFGSVKPVRDPEIEPYVQYAQSKGIETKIGG